MTHPTDPPEYAPGGYVPAPGEAHTCHDHCPFQLRERAIRALAACDARWNDDTGDSDIPAPEYLAQMADAALSVVRPELQRLRSEREGSDKHADRLLDERDKWRREYSKERAQSRHFEAQRDALIEASLATDYTKDHECGTAVDDPDAYEVALANITEMHRVLLVRLERLFQANDARDDEFRRAETAKADRDRALWQRDEATSERDDMQSGWARETTERDTAQAEVKELRERLGEARAACRGLAAALERTVADSVPAQPAYDGSCGASHYGKCGPKNLDCLRRETPLPADDSSEADDLACAQCRAGDYKHWQHSDAENESPPFAVGQYVRDRYCSDNVWQVREVGNGWVNYHGQGSIPFDQVALWRPVKGERVVSPHGQVVKVYDVHGSDPDRVALSPSYSVPISQLRPDVGSEQ